MPFFIDNKHHFLLEPNEGLGLRQCQLGAVWALKSHFTASSHEVAALISMPTGSGKTALMMATCFELKVKKVLIIVPSRILRRQISDQFRALQVLRDNGCLPTYLSEPKVYEVEHRVTAREKWEEILNTHDVIVAHPNSISPYYKQIFPVPTELIDAVFVDEAHHEPARTWKALNSFYNNIKRVFFTATPFRRDKKRMRAKLIYHYSLGKALDEGILRPVNFQGVQVGLQTDDSNRELLETAKIVFLNERTSNPNASILIRTDTIEKADSLVTKYKDAGMNVDVIHSDRSQNVNAELVQKVRDNKLDGLVCVGIASEGLDIPSLKVAVLHATPRSIPYTIQFLGRISRQARSQTGPATLIANKDEVRGEVYRLYKSDEAWIKLIPGVIDNQMRKARHYMASQASEIDFQMPELNIFFSALVYETTTGFSFQQDFETIQNSSITILHVEQNDPDSPLIVVTSYDKPIDWASRKIFIEDVLDVHIFYHNAESNLLFELSTCEIALKAFKDSLIKSDVKQLSHSRLYRTLSAFNQSDYIMVGMKNAAMRGSAQPSYKTVIGNGVQASVRASEGRIFSTGHALLRLDEENTWGIATKRGRVWAMKRGTAEEFKIWCDNLSHLIEAGPNITSLPGLAFLASSSPINSINQIPLAIIPDDVFFRAHSVIIEIKNHGIYRNIIPQIFVDFIDKITGSLQCILKIANYTCSLVMDFNSDNLWTINSKDEITVRADRNENNIFYGTLQEAINDFPPSLIMSNGDVIEGFNRITPNRGIEELPLDVWREESWSNCLITSERYNPNAVLNNLPVINATIDKINQKFDTNSDILILDDGSNEVADLIWFQGVKKVVHFIHCKASTEEKPGCRKNDCDVLFAQALRSIHWVSSTTLLDRLEERLQGNSKIICGLQNTFKAIYDKYRINDWRFKIILVQPGFHHSQVSNRQRANNNVYELAIPVYERILGSTADLEIWCSKQEA